MMGRILNWIGGNIRADALRLLERKAALLERKPAPAGEDACLI